MGFKTFIENIKHAVTPRSLEENMRYNTAIIAINTAHMGEIATETVDHRFKVMNEEIRHLITPHGNLEDLRHGMLVVGEDLRHDVYLKIYELWF